MRKFLAIFVVLALIAPAVFAVDFNVGGRVSASIQGSTADGDDAKWEWERREVGLSASATNDSNTAGASVSFSPFDKSDNDFWTMAWWRPFEQLYVRLGNTDDDGTYWNGDNYTGWGLNANDLNDRKLGPYGMAKYSGDWGGNAGPGNLRTWTQMWNPFAGDLGSNGSTGSWNPKQTALQMTVLPIDGAHLTFRWDLSGDNVIDPLIDKLSIQAKYSIPGAGDAWVSFKNVPEDANHNRNSEIGVGYSMGLGNGMGFEVLVNVPGIGVDGDLQVIRAGLGFGMGERWSGGFMGEQFQFRARLGSVIGLADGQPTQIALDIAPTYDLGIFRAFLHAGFGIGIPDNSDNDVEFRWVVSPYLVKDLGGVLTLWTGASIWSDGPADDQIVRFSIPFILAFSL